MVKSPSRGLKTPRPSEAYKPTSPNYHSFAGPPATQNTKGNRNIKVLAIPEGQPLNASERMRLCGIRCPDEVCFAAGSWDVGQEVVVNFSIRNEWLMPVTIKYTLPRSRSMSLPYPKPIKISPGLTEEIPVTFRPTTYEPLLDEIVVHVKTPAVADVPPAFVICIRAEVNTLSVSHRVPNSTVDFGLVPAGETTTKIIQLFNTGSRVAQIAWKTSEPFSVDPDCCPATIPIGGAAKYSLRISPERGQTIEGLVVATATAGPSIEDYSKLGADSGNNYHMLHETQEVPLRVRGIAKVPHLLFTQSASADQKIITTEEGHARIDFGSCAPEVSHTASFTVTNATAVRTSFVVRPVMKTSLAASSPFDVRLPDGTSVGPSSPCSIGPLESVPLIVSYKSSTVLERVSAEFEISTVGVLKNTLKLAAAARCEPIPVKVNAKSLSFEELQVGKITTKVFYIINESPNVSTQYQVVHARCSDVGEGVGYSVLEIDNSCGVIAPKSTATVTVTARPEIPVNYYRRLWILVRHASEPLYVDCIVNSFDGDQHPMKLTYAHVKLWRAITGAGQDSFPQPSSAHRLPPTAALEDSEGSAETWGELTKPPGILPDSTITLGKCSPTSGPHTRRVVVSNPSPGKVAVYWPNHHSASKPAFDIRPEELEIPGCSSREFTLEYHPAGEGDYRYTVASMDCVMVPKENRSYRIGDAAMLVPPHTSTVVASAHSWPAGCRAQPKVTVNSSTAEKATVRFRSLTPGQTDAQVVVLYNHSDVVVGYRAEWVLEKESGESSSEAFRCFPPIGAIEPRGFALVAVLYRPPVDSPTPREAVEHSGAFTLLLNDLPEATVTIGVKGKCWLDCSLKVGSDENQVITFAPCVTGTVASVSAPLVNPTGVPLKWTIDIPREYRNLFSIPVTNGELSAFGSTSVLVTYHPTTTRARETDIGWLQATSAPLAGGGRECTVRVKLLGFSQDPQVRCEPPAIDLGPIPTLHRITAAVRVRNLSNVEVCYVTRVTLLSHQSPQGDPPVPEDTDLSVSCKVRPEDTKGRVAPGAAQSVVFSVKTAVRGSYRFRLDVLPIRNLPDVPEVTQPSSSELSGVAPIASVIVTAECQSPVVQIRDLRIVSDNLCDSSATNADESDDGPANCRPVSALWQHMMVDDINAALRGPLKDAERDFGEREPGLGPEKKVELFDNLDDAFTLNLGCASVGASTVTIYAAFTNTSDVPAKLRIITPDDINLKGPGIPLWAHSHLDGQDMEEARHHRWVMDEHLLDVRPRQSLIEPGKTVHIKFTYRFAYVGMHVLPVVLQVEHGKHLRLYLTGTTLPRAVPRLSVRQENIVFDPVPIGRGACVHAIELSNIGGCPCTWRIRSDSIDKLNKANYDFKVLDIRPSSGILKANSSTFLRVIFYPLEAMDYRTQVHVEVVAESSGHVDELVLEELDFGIILPAFDPRKTTPRPSSSSIFSPHLPLQPLSPVHTYGAALSVEHLDFGRAPAGSIRHRITVLVNYTEDMVMHYKWDLRGLLSDDDGGGRIIINPQEGYILPGEEQVVAFTLVAPSVGRAEDSEVAMMAIDAEVQCSIVSWVPLEDFKQGYSSQSDDPSPIAEQEEVLAEHRDHRHLPAYSTRDPFKPKHVSVVNRLTVSRYRNLASTVGGQKYLNDNLGRSVMLSIDLPSEAQVDDLHQNLVRSMLLKSHARDQESIARNAIRRDDPGVRDGGVISSLTTLAEEDGEEGPLTYGMNEKPSRCPLHLRITIRPATSDKSDGQSVTARNANDNSLGAASGADSEAVIQRLVQDVLDESSLTELIRAGIGSQTVAPLIEGSLSPRPTAPKVAEDALWNVVPWEMTEDGVLFRDDSSDRKDEQREADAADDEMRSLLRDALIGDSKYPGCDSELLLLRKSWAGSDAWGSAKPPGRSLEEAMDAQEKLLTEGTGEVCNLEDLSKFSNETLKGAVLSIIEEQLRCDRSPAETTS